MATVQVTVIGRYGNFSIATLSEHEIMSPGWAILYRTFSFRPAISIRKFGFEDEAMRAWQDILNGATTDDIRTRDYSDAPPTGEPIPLADHRRLRR